MSIAKRQPAAGAPRLVTKRVGATSDAERWSSGEGPHPVAQADALGATIIAYLITGPLLFGGIGMLADRWLGTSVLAGLGAALGAGLSLYVIWLRYGTSQAPANDRDHAHVGADHHHEEKK